jgi:regulator of protease activity HflC (stomatin/prohibitin superfamily)
MEHTQPRTEVAYKSLSGYAALATAAVLAVVALFMWVVVPFVSVIAIMAAIYLALGLYMLQPKEAAVLTLFGKYVGTDRSEGLRFTSPFNSKRKISVRARNFVVPTIKVNDKKGNPIEISAAIVCKVQDTAKALFEVDNYEKYVMIQAESALRNLASHYAYDEDDVKNEAGDVTKAITLRGSLDEVGAKLKTELQDRFNESGVDVVDAKLTHLAYAPEIAQVMLRRQQAEAIVSARTKIVEGAVGMVELAFAELKKKGIVDLDDNDDRKVAMVNNLMVVLCADKEVQPVSNTGTLHH